MEQNDASLFVNNHLLIPCRARLNPLLRPREREQEAVNTHKIQIFHPRQALNPRAAAGERP